MCYPVLALLSKGCPGLRGRLSTCYSPVRHSTHFRRSFLVRLACVKHTASVRSEPGSNSQVNMEHRSAPSNLKFFPFEYLLHSTSSYVKLIYITISSSFVLDYTLTYPILLSMNYARYNSKISVIFLQEKNSF